MFAASSVVDERVVGFSVSTQSGTNVVGLVVFSVVLGVIVGRMGDAGRPVRDFVDALQQAILQIVTLVIWSVSHSLTSRALSNSC